MKTWQKNILTFIIGLGIGVGFLYLVLRNQDMGKIWQNITKVNILWLLASIAVIFSAYLTRMVRWSIILAPVKKVSFKNLFSSTMIGFMAVALLPLRVGEIIRPYLLARRENISKSLTFATIIPVERLFDLSAILSFFAVYLILVPTPHGAAAEQLDALATLKSASVFLVAGIFLAAILFVLLRFKSEKFLSVTGKFFSIFSKKWAARFNKILASFVEGLTIIKNAKQFSLTYLWSLATWFAIGLSFWCVLAAFGIMIPIYHIFVILFLTAAGAAIPVPAGIGPWHYLAYVGVHYFYGVPDSIAWAAVFVMHIVGFFLAVIIGPFFAIREIKDISEILKRGKSGKTK
jgi:uncharacterized protein (TIRG00374 family)